MNAYKTVLTVIKVVLALAQVEVEDTDGIHLLYFHVAFAKRDMLGNGFSHAVEYTFQVVNLTRVLNLDDDYLALAVAGFDVNTVELVVYSFLVRFALKYLIYGHFLAEEYGEEAFQHAEVGFLTEQSLDRPVKTDVFIFQFAHTILCIFVSVTTTAQRYTLYMC